MPTPPYHQPENIEETISNSLNRLIANGKLEEIIDKEITDAVHAAIRSSLTFGDGRKIINEKINESLVQALNTSNLPELNTKLELTFNEIIRESQLHDTRNLLQNFKGLLTPAIKPYAEIPAEEIFIEYGKYLSAHWDCTGREVDTDDEPSYVPIHATLELDIREDSYYWRKSENATLRLHADIEADDYHNEPCDVNFDIPLYRFSYKTQDDAWSIHNIIPVDFGGISKMNPFEVYITSLANANCKIIAPPDISLEDWFEPEDIPECDFF